MSTTNTALMGHLGRMGFTVDDDKSAGTASSQSGANALLSAASRVTVAAANGSLVLKSILSEEAPPIVFVLNDSGQTIKVYAAPNDNMNGSANGSLSIADGGFGFFSRVKSTTDWRSGAIT